ncbi:MAG: hypothetical protein M3541_13555 [Acidobacteriota bacterium]|nr:hypothetical protein [Acidobacteriota bacterium]
MDRNPFADILTTLQSNEFRDITGARMVADVPVSARLINEVVAAAIPPNVPVREVVIRPEANDQFSVRIMPRATFLPALTLRLAIERQPDFPSFPVLVMRMKTMGGLFGFASAALPIATMLPPGVRLEGERILVDLAALAAQRGFAGHLQYVRRLAIHSEDGRMIVHVEAAA